jgi:hypothetical protein
MALPDAGKREKTLFIMMGIYENAILWWQCTILGQRHDLTVDNSQKGKPVVQFQG